MNEPSTFEIGGFNDSKPLIMVEDNFENDRDRASEEPRFFNGSSEINPSSDTHKVKNSQII